MTKFRSTLACAALGCTALASAAALAQAPEVDGARWAAEAQTLATTAARAAFAGRDEVRVEVLTGALDPRLRLAPCARVETYLPPGQRAWGRMRVGVRCVEGTVAWNVYLPVTVKVFAPALVAALPLAAGSVLQPHQLKVGEADWAAAESPIVALPERAIGRALARGLAAGAALRESDLKRRLWFSAGDNVRVTARGRGFAVAGEGVALSNGIEGQSVRVRVEGGRTVTGVAAGERRVELIL